MTADMGLRTPNVAALFTHINCNIAIFDYRGYGHSEGEPDEEGLMKDADVFPVTRVDFAGFLLTSLFSVCSVGCDEVGFGT